MTTPRENIVLTEYFKAENMLRNALSFVGRNEGNKYTFVRLLMEENEDLKQYILENKDAIKKLFHNNFVYKRLKSNSQTVLHMIRYLKVNFTAKKIRQPITVNNMKLQKCSTKYEVFF